MNWGFAGPWYGEFTERNGKYPGNDWEQIDARLEFLKKHDLVCTGFALKEFATLSEERRDALTARLGSDELMLTASVGCHYLTATDDEIKQYNDQAIADLQRYVAPMRSKIVTIHKGPGHRFDGTLPVEDQLEKLAKGFAPVARACHELGVPLGIENHGDYYCSDLVQLCDTVPHMYIFLDTGNTYLIGEKPLPAFEEAAPYVIGTHFKDHFVEPVAEGLHFDIHGAALGDGHVPLRECYKLVQEYAPFPDQLVMELEMICPKESMAPPECLERSLAFVRSLDQ